MSSNLLVVSGMIKSDSRRSQSPTTCDSTHLMSRMLWGRDPAGDDEQQEQHGEEPHFAELEILLGGLERHFDLVLQTVNGHGSIGALLVVQLEHLAELDKSLQTSEAWPDDKE